MRPQGRRAWLQTPFLIHHSSCLVGGFVQKGNNHSLFLQKKKNKNKIKMKAGKWTVNQLRSWFRKWHTNLCTCWKKIYHVINRFSHTPFMRFYASSWAQITARSLEAAFDNMLSTLLDGKREGKMPSQNGHNCTTFVPIDRPPAFWLLRLFKVYWWSLIM